MTTKISFLCFFGDGDLWENTTQVMGYPSGFSYFRSFRYRGKRISEEILELIKTGQSEKLIGNAILAMRFFDQENNLKILPLREIKITKLLYLGDTFDIFFRLGRMNDFSETTTLKNMCIDISDETHQNLFFFQNIHSDNLNNFENSNEAIIWSAYCDKIACDDSLPINQNARQSIFLRLSKKNLKIDEIQKSELIGEQFGVTLFEGEKREFIITHRAPYFFDKNIAIHGLNLEYRKGTNNYELNKSIEYLSSNYQNHHLILSGLRETETSEQLVVSTNENRIEFNNNFINLSPLIISLKIKRSDIFRFKTRGIYYLIFLGGLMVLGLGDLLPDDTNIIYKVLYYLLFSAIASFGNFFAKEHLK